MQGKSKPQVIHGETEVNIGSMVGGIPDYQLGPLPWTTSGFSIPNRLRDTGD